MTLLDLVLTTDKVAVRLTPDDRSAPSPTDGSGMRLALLAAGCSARETARFPGSPVPQTATAPAPTGPASEPVLRGGPVTEPPPLPARGADAGQRDGSDATDATVAASIFEIQVPALDPGACGNRRSVADRSRYRHPVECQGLAVRPALHWRAEALPGGGPQPRQAVSTDDPGRPSGRRPAAGPCLRAARRERLQAEGGVSGQGQGNLAVHAGHRAGERADPRLVH